MNATELLVLSCGLYAHDWGMAVSESDRAAITSDRVGENRFLLPDENRRFATFVASRQVTPSAMSSPSPAAEAAWREYVRQTHALRSAVRARAYFETIDRGLAESVARVCIGHWLPIEDLTDYRSYPPDFSVLREAVNLRAVTTYVRLIDLFDLGEDRTPYVIWKFVAPHDSQSILEWHKHRALQPITCPHYLDGRIVRVDGSTDDHEVFAALEDLRHYCDEQLRGCLDVLARMNDSRHLLDLFHVDWRVATPTFRPITIRFEFDRAAMFRMLSDDIYKGDVGVFLRELLQNSIDAIRVRQEVLERRGLSPQQVGAVRLEIEPTFDNVIRLKWTDDGIGMDEHIVRHYLAVAGRSYYRSDDFGREHFRFRPISSFGVGVLSCFMVADRMELRTYRDPYLQPQAQPLHVVIPSVDRQFRVETRSAETASIGTTVELEVDLARWAGDDSARRDLETAFGIPNYLCHIGGFAEFGISISCLEKRWLVTRPDRQMMRQDGVALVHLRPEMSMDDVFLPQDVSIAKRIMKQVALRLDVDLGVHDYEGTVAFLMPRDFDIDLESVSPGPGINEVTTISRSDARDDGLTLRWKHEWARGSYRNEDDDPTFAVYRDGILIEDAPAPFRARELGRDYGLPSPKIVANISSKRIPRVDLARRSFLDLKEPWVTPIRDGLVAYVRRQFGDELLSLAPLERAYRLGWLVAAFNLDEMDVADIVPPETIPIIEIRAGGVVVARDQSTFGETFLEAPGWLADVSATLVRNAAFRNAEPSGLMTRWRGEAIVPRFSFYESNAVAAMINMSRYLFERATLRSLRFVTSPWEDVKVLAQRRWSLMPRKVDVDVQRELLSIAAGADTYLRGEDSDSRRLFENVFQAVAFEQPFENRLAFGFGTLNAAHPITKYLRRLAAKLTLAGIGRVGHSADAGVLIDAIAAWPVCQDHHGELSIDELRTRLRTIVDRARMFPDIAAPEPAVEAFSLEDFVPGSLDHHADKVKTRHLYEARFLSTSSPRECGQPILAM